MMHSSEEVAIAISDLVGALGGINAAGEVTGIERAIWRSGKRISDAITADAGLGHDATGGAVGSLTEAVMGVTAGLVQIATAIDGLAEAVKEARCNE